MIALIQSYKYQEDPDLLHKIPKKFSSRKEGNQNNYNADVTYIPIVMYNERLSQDLTSVKKLASIPVIKIVV